MLTDYDPLLPLYVYGQGVAARELEAWIKTTESHCGKISQIGQDEFSALPHQSQVIVGFANNQYRMRTFQSSWRHRYRWVGYVHPSSMIPVDTIFGIGSVIQPGVWIGHEVTIGNFAWITTLCHVGHGASLGENVVLNPKSLVLGSTCIGSNVWIGAASTVADHVTITNNCEFLMTSTVTKSIVQPGRYLGNRRLPDADS